MAHPVQHVLPAPPLREVPLCTGLVWPVVMLFKAAITAQTRHLTRLATITGDDAALHRDIAAVTDTLAVKSVFLRWKRALLHRLHAPAAISALLPPDESHTSDTELLAVHFEELRGALRAVAAGAVPGDDDSESEAAAASARREAAAASARARMLASLTAWCVHCRALLSDDLAVLLPWLSRAMRASNSSDLLRWLVEEVVPVEDAASVLRWVERHQGNARRRTALRAALASGLGWMRAQELLTRPPQKAVHADGGDEPPRHARAALSPPSAQPMEADTTPDGSVDEDDPDGGVGLAGGRRRRAAREAGRPWRLPGTLEGGEPCPTPRLERAMSEDIYKPRLHSLYSRGEGLSSSSSSRRTSRPSSSDHTLPSRGDRYHTLRGCASATMQLSHGPASIGDDDSSELPHPPPALPAPGATAPSARTAADAPLRRPSFMAWARGFFGSPAELAPTAAADELVALPVPVQVLTGEEVMPVGLLLALAGPLSTDLASPVLPLVPSLAAPLAPPAPPPVQQLALSGGPTAAAESAQAAVGSARAPAGSVRAPAGSARAPVGPGAEAAPQRACWRVCCYCCE